MMNRVITVQPAPESAVGQLLAQLEAVEADVAAQRSVVTAAREAYQEAELAQRRAHYNPSLCHRSDEELDTEHAHVMELLRTRDREDQKLAPLLRRMAELRERFDHDYREFLRL